MWRTTETEKTKWQELFYEYKGLNRMNILDRVRTVVQMCKSVLVYPNRLITSTDVYVLKPVHYYSFIWIRVPLVWIYERYPLAIIVVTQDTQLPTSFVLPFVSSVVRTPKHILLNTILLVSNSEPRLLNRWYTKYHSNSYKTKCFPYIMEVTF